MLFRSTVKFFIPTVKVTHNYIKNYINEQDVNINVIKGDANSRYDLFAKSTLALATSGSVSLELGFAKVPHCICYKFSWITHLILKQLIKVKFANLINILNNREIIPEYIQDDCRSENLAYFAFSILSDKKKKLAYLENLKFGIKKLSSKKGLPTENIIKALKKIL